MEQSVQILVPTLNMILKRKEKIQRQCPSIVCHILKVID